MAAFPLHPPAPDCQGRKRILPEAPGRRLTPQRSPARTRCPSCVGCSGKHQGVFCFPFFNSLPFSPSHFILSSLRERWDKEQTVKTEGAQSPTGSTYWNTGNTLWSAVSKAWSVSCAELLPRGRTSPLYHHSSPTEVWGDEQAQESPLHCSDGLTAPPLQLRTWGWMGSLWMWREGSSDYGPSSALALYQLLTSASDTLYVNFSLNLWKAHSLGELFQFQNLQRYIVFQVFFIYY